MTSRWLRQRWLWVLTAGILVAAAGVATVWVTNGGAGPLHKDCATVQDLGHQSHELGARMNTGLDPGEIVARQSALSDKIRAAAGSVTTPQLKTPLTIWADAVALDAKLQRQANDSGASQPPRQWMLDAQRANLLTDEALVS